MIIAYSKNPFQQTFGILIHNIWRILFCLICAAVAYATHDIFGHSYVKLPAVPISILGGALAIFLGFRNSSAYDRWWEARKIWGEIVNNSRAFTMQLLTYSSKGESTEMEFETWQKEVIYRHIGWVYALKSVLRKEPYCKELQYWIPEKDESTLKDKSNIPTQLLAIQGQELKYALHKGWIEDFRLYNLTGLVTKLYDNQGKCERIKNTVFPFYYNYFTRLFLWLFIICLPFALVESMDWVSIPMSIAIGFVFTVLEKSGINTEDPFEGRASDIPLENLCRNIEIDLREMIEDTNI
ncbi:bestrophin family protein, partial [Xanthovirga aplysinae]|uniref:bestrophin family protein n=1 Tax=Xanthovirga aplysinae TaxID=2529853 RepID=UPI0012BCD880